MLFVTTYETIHRYLCIALCFVCRVILVASHVVSTTIIIIVRILLFDEYSRREIECNSDNSQIFARNHWLWSPSTTSYAPQTTYWIIKTLLFFHFQFLLVFRVFASAFDSNWISRANEWTERERKCVNQLTATNQTINQLNGGDLYRYELRPLPLSVTQTWIQSEILGWYCSMFSIQLASCVSAMHNIHNNNEQRMHSIEHR